MMKYIYIFFFGVALQSCSAPASTILENDEMHVIDIDNIEATSTIKLSTYFSSLEYIPLETNSEALLGRINKLYAYNDTLFILDKVGSKGLFMFDRKNGSFLGRVGAIGAGPGEYSNLGDFTIDIENKRLYLLDLDRQQIYEYELGSCRYLANVNLEAIENRSYHIQYWKNRMYGDIFFRKRSTKNDSMLCEIDMKTGKMNNFWLSAQQYNLGWSERFFMNEVFYSQPSLKPKFTQLFMNMIMEIDDDGISPFLLLKSKNWVSEDELDQGKSDPYERYSGLFQMDRIYNMGNLLESKDFIYFSYMEGMSTYHVFYNPKTKEVVYSGLIENDLLFKKNVLDNIELNFCFSDNEGGYCYIHPFGMGKFIEGIHSDIFKRNASYDKLLQLNEESNPVLLYYKYKK